MQAETAAVADARVLLNLNRAYIEAVQRSDARWFDRMLTSDFRCSLPDGTFIDPSLETSLEPGGRLGGQIRALLDLAADPASPAVDVAVSPVLLTQLGRMRGGYSVVEDGQKRDVAPGQGGAELAARALDDLRAIAADPRVEVTTLVGPNGDAHVYEPKPADAADAAAIALCHVAMAPMRAASARSDRAVTRVAP